MLAHDPKTAYDFPFAIDLLMRARGIFVVVALACVVGPRGLFAGDVRGGVPGGAAPWHANDERAQDFRRLDLESGLSDHVRETAIQQLVSRVVERLWHNPPTRDLIAVPRPSLVTSSSCDCMPRQNCVTTGSSS